MTEVKWFRKKPVAIQAMGPFTEANGEEIAKWCGGKMKRGDSKPSDPADYRVYMLIPTLERPMEASLGDMIIRGVAGEFYPCKPDIFEATYEAVPS